MIPDALLHLWPNANLTAGGTSAGLSPPEVESLSFHFDWSDPVNSLPDGLHPGAYWGRPLDLIVRFYPEGQSVGDCPTALLPGCKLLRTSGQIGQDATKQAKALIQQGRLNSCWLDDTPKYAGRPGYTGNHTMDELCSAITQTEGWDGHANLPQHGVFEAVAIITPMPPGAMLIWNQAVLHNGFACKPTSRGRRTFEIQLHADPEGVDTEGYDMIRQAEFNKMKSATLPNKSGGGGSTSFGDEKSDL